MISPFADQAEWVDGIRGSMRISKAVLGQASTGFGKTVCAMMIIDAAMQKGSRVIMTFPRRDLLVQTMETAQKNGFRFGIIAQGFAPDPFPALQLATVQTLARRLEKTKAPKIIIVDETHFGAGDLDRIISWAKEAGAWVLGLSATPLKMNGKPMSDWYDTIVVGPDVRTLIDNNRLSDFRYFAPVTPDLSGIKVTNGDYVQKQLAEFMEGQSVLIGDMVKSWRATSEGKITVGFAVSRKHAGIMADAFNAAGIRSMMVDGTVSDNERRLIIRGLARREYDVLWSVQLLQFGFDLSQAAQMPVTVEAMIDAQPTKSLPMISQKWGRVLRAKPYPAIINDHAGNCAAHGFPDTPREWTLDGRSKRKTGRERAEATRQCEIANGGCGFVARVGPPCCPNCGLPYPVQSRMVEEIDGELAEIDRSQAVLERKREQAQAQTLEDLLRLARQKGRNPGWAHHVWQARQRRRA